MSKFRFEDFEIWQDAISLTDDMLDIADRLEKSRRYKFAEQLRGAILSISNNIAEGSGSSSNKEFSNFLNMSKRSCFEVVNILLVLQHRQQISDQNLNHFLEKLDYLSRKITKFRHSLTKN